MAQGYLEVDSPFDGSSDEPALWLQCDFCRYVRFFFPGILRFMLLLLENFVSSGLSSSRERGIER